MDYIFYRIYLFYKKRDYIPINMGINFLFVVKLSLFFLIATVFNLLTGGYLSAKYLEKNTFWVIFLGILLPIFIIDLIRYFKKGKVQSIIKKYENSPLNKKIKTWQIFIIPVLVVLLTVAIILIFT